MCHQRSNKPRIDSANAISDVYAMGGKPVLAIAILSWPIEKLPQEMAQLVLEARELFARKDGVVHLIRHNANLQNVAVMVGRHRNIKTSGRQTNFAQGRRSLICHSSQKKEKQRHPQRQPK